MVAEYYITLLTLVGIYSIAALGLNITMGFAGQINLGQAAFLGIGAMTSVILTMNLGFPFIAGFFMSGLVSLLIGLILGVISIRLRHDFLAITTIGFNFIVVGIFSYYEIFGGSTGIIGIPYPEILGYKLSQIGFALFVYAVLVLAMLGAVWIKKSWIGKAFEALREDEDVAQSMGIDVRKYKILAFAIGTALAGFSGSLLAHFQTSISYENFLFVNSIKILSMSVLGGLDSIIGALIGSAIVVLFPELFRPLMEYRLAFYSLIIILVLIFMPEGIAGKQNVMRKWLGLSEKKRIWTK